jgi:peptidyl-prolyl cis-trans isomerase SurA
MKHVIGPLLCAVCVVAAAAAPRAQVALPTPAPSVPPSPAVPVAPQVPASPAAPASTIVERVLVRVNGEIFTQSQLTRRQIDALRDLKENARAGSNIEAELTRLTPDLLVAAVDELLLVQQGRELGLTFTEDQFKSALENIKKQNKLDDAGFKTALEQEGLTLEELRQNFERSYLAQGVQQREIGPSMTITLEEQRQYYKRNGDQFMTPLTVTLRELFLNVATRTQGNEQVFSVADDEAAKAKIEEFRKRALAGEDFAALVTANSESATKASGGLVGPVNVEDLSPALKDLVAKLEPGGISEPVRTPRGYQIFKLEQRSVPALRPFDEVRRDIENAIRNERIGPETIKLLARLRTQAVIEWKDETLRQMYETRVAETAAP